MIRGKPKKKTGASSLGKFAQENYVKPDHTFTAAKWDVLRIKYIIF